MPAPSPIRNTQRTRNGGWSWGTRTVRAMRYQCTESWIAPWGLGQSSGRDAWLATRFSFHGCALTCMPFEGRLDWLRHCGCKVFVGGCRTVPGGLCQLLVHCGTGTWHFPQYTYGQPWHLPESLPCSIPTIAVRSVLFCPLSSISRGPNRTQPHVRALTRARPQPQPSHHWRRRSFRQQLCPAHTSYGPAGPPVRCCRLVDRWVF